ncbi:MAG: hypothetical protein ACC628_08885 [Pirellulaceae bacterium]
MPEAAPVGVQGHYREKVVCLAGCNFLQKVYPKAYCLPFIFGKTKVNGTDLFVGIGYHLGQDKLDKGILSVSSFEENALGIYFPGSVGCGVVVWKRPKGCLPKTIGCASCIGWAVGFAAACRLPICFVAGALGAGYGCSIIIMEG